MKTGSVKEGFRNMGTSLVKMVNVDAISPGECDIMLQELML
jgi:hypothetical protein